MKRCLAVILFSLAMACSAAALDREAFTITRYQLDVQIDRASHVMAVTGQLTLRNDSKSPQKYATLQVSSSLSWNLGGRYMTNIVPREVNPLKGFRSGPIRSRVPRSPALFAPTDRWLP